ESRGMRTGRLRTGPPRTEGSSEGTGAGSSGISAESGTAAETWARRSVLPARANVDPWWVVRHKARPGSRPPWPVAGTRPSVEEERRLGSSSTGGASIRRNAHAENEDEPGCGQAVQSDGQRKGASPQDGWTALLHGKEPQASSPAPGQRLGRSRDRTAHQDSASLRALKQDGRARSSPSAVQAGRVEVG